MANKSLIPWRRGKESSLEVRRERDPYRSIQQEMNRLFDEFFELPKGSPFGSPFGLRSLNTFEGFEDFTPRLDVYETEKEINIRAELPGMEEKDIDISLHNNVLTISGKKESEEVEKGKSFYRRERSYGAFQRSIELPDEVDETKIEANYDKGILKVTVPKPAEAVSVARRIKIKKG